MDIDNYQPPPNWYSYRYDPSWETWLWYVGEWYELDRSHLTFYKHIETSTCRKIH